MIAHGMQKSLGTPDQRELQALIIEAQKKAALTQQELAKRLRRPQSFVARHEGGRLCIDALEFLTILALQGPWHGYADPTETRGRIGSAFYLVPNH